MKHYVGWGLMILSFIIGFIAFCFWYLDDSIAGKIVCLLCIAFQIFGILTKG